VAPPEPSELTVRPYGAADRDTWDALVDASRTRHFLFRRDYMEYHRDRFEDASLVVLDDDRPVALLPASREGDVVISHAGLTFGGLISTPALTTRRTLLAVEQVLASLREDAVRSLVYKAVPHIYHAVPAEEDLYALFLNGAALVRRDCSAALRPGDHPPFRKGRRAAASKARRSGVSVARETGFAEFMQLDAEALRRRHGVAPVHSGEEMTTLARAFPESIKLFGARQGDELLAGVIVYETEVVAHAQYIAASERGYAENALDAVLDFLIEQEYREKRWFDFGISTTEEGRSLNEGLMRNKEGFGARAVAYDTYLVELAR
jgi:Acetyltransferase (GNAT) domain